MRISLLSLSVLSISLSFVTLSNGLPFPQNTEGCPPNNVACHPDTPASAPPPASPGGAPPMSGSGNSMPAYSPASSSSISESSPAPCPPDNVACHPDQPSGAAGAAQPPNGAPPGGASASGMSGYPSQSSGSGASPAPVSPPPTTPPPTSPAPATNPSYPGESSPDQSTSGSSASGSTYPPSYAGQTSPDQSSPSSSTASSSAIPPTYPGNNRRRSEPDTLVNDVCSKGQEMCPVPGTRRGDQLDHKCVDVGSDVRNCGGCANSDPFLPAPGYPGAPGQDCTALEGARNVSCASRTCVVNTCKDGYVVAEDKTQCLIVAASKRTVLDSYSQATGVPSSHGESSDSSLHGKPDRPWDNGNFKETTSDAAAKNIRAARSVIATTDEGYVGKESYEGESGYEGAYPSSVSAYSPHISSTERLDDSRSVEQLSARSLPVVPEPKYGYVGEQSQGGELSSVTTQGLSGAYPSEVPSTPPTPSLLARHTSVSGYVGLEGYPGARPTVDPSPFVPRSAAIQEEVQSIRIGSTAGFSGTLSTDTPRQTSVPIPGDDDSERRQPFQQAVPASKRERISDLPSANGESNVSSAQGEVDTASSNGETTSPYKPSVSARSPQLLSPGVLDGDVLNNDSISVLSSLSRRESSSGVDGVSEGEEGSGEGQGLEEPPLPLASGTSSAAADLRRRQEDLINEIHILTKKTNQIDGTTTSSTSVDLEKRQEDGTDDLGVGDIGPLIERANDDTTTSSTLVAFRKRQEEGVDDFGVGEISVLSERANDETATSSTDITFRTRQAEALDDPVIEDVSILTRRALSARTSKSEKRQLNEVTGLAGDLTGILGGGLLGGVSSDSGDGSSDSSLGATDAPNATDSSAADSPAAGLTEGLKRRQLDEVTGLLGSLTGGAGALGGASGVSEGATNSTDSTTAGGQGGSLDDLTSGLKHRQLDAVTEVLGSLTGGEGSSLDGLKLRQLDDVTGLLTGGGLLGDDSSELQGVPNSTNGTDSSVPSSPLGGLAGGLKERQLDEITALLDGVAGGLSGGGEDSGLDSGYDDAAPVSSAASNAATVSATPASGIVRRRWL